MLRSPGFCITGFVAYICVIAPCFAADEPVAPASIAAIPKGQWANISDPVINQLKSQQARIGFPGQTSGISVDPTTGEVYLVVCGQGLWKSTDHGSTFSRCDGGAIGGRCETGFALNFDTAGKRFACFMLDGTASMSLDAGATWQKFKDVGRNWDYAAVDWTPEQPQTIFAARHESGGEMYLSGDAGASWKLIGKSPKLGAMGLFDAQHLLVSGGEGLGLSIDGGKTWQKVCDATPVGRVMRVLNGIGWWISDDGLITSKDKGQTWEKVGNAVTGSLGPYFDPKDPKHIMVAGNKGFFETTDGAVTWNLVAPLPEGVDVVRPGWFTSVGWDPLANILYISQMGKSAYKYER